MSKENTIEVGSLWTLNCENEPFKVVCVTEHAIYTETLEHNQSGYWRSKLSFIDSCTPYTPPKEYKVWVYEDIVGKPWFCDEPNDSFSLTLKAILTGKEGDGL